MALHHTSSLSMAILNLFMLSDGKNHSFVWSSAIHSNPFRCKSNIGIIFLQSGIYTCASHDIYLSCLSSMDFTVECYALKYLIWLVRLIASTYCMKIVPNHEKLWCHQFWCVLCGIPLKVSKGKAEASALNLWQPGDTGGSLKKHVVNQQFGIIHRKKKSNRRVRAWHDIF